jgi:putative sterol carrier protein
MTVLFTQPWAEAWGDALNRSEDYHRAARLWEGDVVLEALADPARGLSDTVAVYLDLHRGQCRAARVATAEDLAGATYLMSGPLATWLTVLDGELSPAMAILGGRLTLRNGSMMSLMPHVQAANELVRVARTVNAGAPGAT